jgi:GNAT superfamily N-acetyltransferase
VVQQTRRVQIRAAMAEDQERMAQMRVTFLEDVRGGEALADEFVAAPRAFVLEVHTAGRLLSWIAEEDGAWLGVVSMLLHRTPPHPDFPQMVEGYLVNMYVDPSQRGRGIGRALLVACRAEGIGLGLRRLYLHTTEPGRPMYESAGFVPDARWMHLHLVPVPS